MTNVRAQVILHTTDSVAANYMTNSWAIITTDAPSPAELTEFTVAFKDFYDDLAGLLGLPLAQSGHEIKFYDLDQLTPPNYPLGVTTWALASAPSGASLPSEVALCLSFQAEKVPGFPQNRRRGRVYIGPVTQSVNTGGRPTSGAMSQLAGAANVLTANLKAASNVSQLAVWSHVNTDAVPVTDGWVDNSWDTQRRRGVPSTSRTLWVAT